MRNRISVDPNRTALAYVVQRDPWSGEPRWGTGRYVAPSPEAADRAAAEALSEVEACRAALASVLDGHYPPAPDYAQTWDPEVWPRQCRSEAMAALSRAEAKVAIMGLRD